jgi:MraZ protein
VGQTARHPILIGEYELTLDEKKRLLVPAEVRRAIPPEYGESFYLVMGVNRVLWLWPSRAYEELVMQVPSDMIPGEDALAFDQYVFGMAAKLDWDKQGRILVPERMLKRAGFEKDVKEVTLVGARDHIEVWGRSQWEARREELEKRGPEVFLRAKQARMNPSVQQPIAAAQPYVPVPPAGR